MESNTLCTEPQQPDWNLITIWTGSLHLESTQSDTCMMSCVLTLRIESLHGSGIEESPILVHRT